MFPIDSAQEIDRSGRANPIFRAGEKMARLFSEYCRIHQDITANLPYDELILFWIQIVSDLGLVLRRLCFLTFGHVFLLQNAQNVIF